MMLLRLGWKVRPNCQCDNGRDRDAEQGAHVRSPLAFGRELSLSNYPHTSFDCPLALCRASQKG
jgi:hypothetical protein